MELNEQEVVTLINLLNEEKSFIEDRIKQADEAATGLNAPEPIKSLVAQLHEAFDNVSYNKLNIINDIITKLHVEKFEIDNK